MLGVEAADNVLFGTKARLIAVLQSARASTIPAEHGAPSCAVSLRFFYDHFLSGPPSWLPMTPNQSMWALASANAGCV